MRIQGRRYVERPPAYPGEAPKRKYQSSLVVIRAAILRLASVAEMDAADPIKRLAFAIVCQAIKDLVAQDQGEQRTARRYFKTAEENGDRIMWGLGLDPAWVLETLTGLGLMDYQAAVVH